MAEKKNFYSLGIDIGSTTVKIAILDPSGLVVFSDYTRHFADIQGTLAGLLEKAKEQLGAPWLLFWKKQKSSLVS